MRYIRAVQLQRQIAPEQSVHKVATQEIRPPLLAAVSCCSDWSGREDANLRPLGPEPTVWQKGKFLPFQKLQPPSFPRVFTFRPVRYPPLHVVCWEFCPQIGHTRRVRFWSEIPYTAEMATMASITVNDARPNVLWCILGQALGSVP
jgi:hypothetical protein